jgi:hypothetical protein
MREWAHTFPNGFSLWELESLWTPKFLESNLKGQNSLDWKVSYTIGKFLKCKCLKWTCMIHLSIYNISYGWKKGQESKCQFDSWPLKVKNCLELHLCKWSVTYHWKAFDKGYNFDLDLTLIGGLHSKLWASKVMGVLILRILRFPVCESWENWHLGVAPMANHREYYKWEGGGFPQVRAMVSFVSLCMLMVRPCTKSAPIMH